MQLHHERVAFPKEPGDAGTTDPHGADPNGNAPVGTVGPDVVTASDPGGPIMGSGGWGVIPSPWAGWPGSWGTSFGAEPWAAANVVGTCADAIARTIADFPLIVEKGAKPLDPQPAWVDACEPEVYPHTGAFVKTALLSMLLAGEVFVYATYRNAEGYPSRFVALNPHRVSVERLPGSVRPIIRVENGEPLEPDDVLHVKYADWPPGSLRGVGPLAWAARSLVSAAALEQYGAQLAANGGVPWAVLKHPARLDPAQAAELRRQWAEGAQTRGGSPAVLSGGIELETLTLSPKDMALIELLQWDAQQVAAAMGVPPFLVGLPSPNGMNYSSTQMLLEFWYRTGLKPLAGNLSAALSNWALPRGTTCNFRAAEFVEAAFIDDADQWVKLKDAGVVSVDELRAIGRIDRRTAIAEQGL